MTEQQAADAGRINAGQSKAEKSPKAVKSALHNTLTAAGFAQDENGTFVVQADALPKDHNRRASESDDRLRLLIERIERLEEEKKGVGDDIKDVYNEAKATGYDAKIMRKVVRLRKMKPDDRREAEAVLATYCASLGMDTQGLLF